MLVVFDMSRLCVFHFTCLIYVCAISHVSSMCVPFPIRLPHLQVRCAAGLCVSHVVFISLACFFLIRSTSLSHTHTYTHTGDRHHVVAQAGGARIGARCRAWTHKRQVSGESFRTYE